MGKIYSVGQINTYIKHLFTDDFLLSYVCVKGEVSNCKYHSSGHIYFTLKDGTSTIACVMFQGSRAKGLKFQLEQGQSVVVGGSVSIYERDGKYQLYAKEIMLDGAGRYYEEYERLKQKLFEEGLFDFEHKKSIPAYPKRIGIVTAPTGAAIQDIRNIARRRNPFVQLILYPAKVQGDGAAATICKGIRVLDTMELDTIIIGRGGGSIEDLWAFNDEELARTIYHAKTPIISGTGHEIDNTIADYVADLRAPTPSAACELALPDIVGVLQQIQQYGMRMHRGMDHILEARQMEYRNLLLRLQRVSPEVRLRNWQQEYDELCLRMRQAMERKYEQRLHTYQLLAERVHGLSPTKKLVNGFAYVESDGKPLKDIATVKEGNPISLRMQSGKIDAVVTKVTLET